MMKLNYIFLILFVYLNKFVIANWNLEDLIQNRGYRLYWKLVDNNESVQFKVEVKTRGYFALGVSKLGGMNHADVVTGYVHLNGSAILHNRFSNGQKMPEIVEKQNWQLISGSRNETHLTFEFKRKLAIEDPNVDVAIIDGSNNIIYATGKVDPKDRTKVKYHGPKSRGSKAINFLA